MRRPKLYTAVGVAVALVLAAWLTATTRHAPPVTLRAGYSEFPPYVTTDENGNPAGLAVQVVRQAASRTGIRLQWVKVVDAEKALREGQINLYPLLTVSAERQQTFHLSVPWWESSLSLLSLRERPLKNPAAAVGRRIAIRDPAFGVATASQLPGALTIPARGHVKMISDLCTGEVDGVLLDGRLIYGALLDQPAACANHPLLVVPLPYSTLPMATFARPEVKAAADRLFAGIEQIALDGTLTTYANQWFALPQQRYERDRLAERQQRQLNLLYAAGALLFSLLSLWYSRRSFRMRRAAEEAGARARSAELRFEAFMEHTPAMALLKDESGRIIYANKALLKSCGLEMSEVSGMIDHDLFGHFSADTVRTHDQEVLRTGSPVQYLLPLTAPDGTRHHWLVLKFPLAGEAGQPLLGITAMDITEQQAAADLVARSAERFRLLFEEAPVAMHEIDRDGIVTRVNRAGCALGGYSREEIVGRHVAEFIPPGQREDSRTAVRAKLSGVQPLTPVERPYLRKDGRVLRVEVHDTAIRPAGGEIEGLRTCLVDLTERYEARQRLDAFALQLQENNAALALALESAREATRLKGQFLANMSHEIRTPMNGVLGMAELLLESGLSSEQEVLACGVSRSGEQLLTIINDILDFSKIESGKLELEHAPFDLGAVVEGAVELMAPAAHAKGLELTYWVEPEVPTRLLGDEARLRQVLLNLVGNAVKFTLEGEIAVSVSVRRDANGADRLHVSVTDTGIGIAEDAIRHLFEPFTQADNSTTRRFGGTGLGLAIARRVVTLMQGEMGVESEPGRGSRFWFTAVVEADTAAPAISARGALGGARVLIVDDNAASRAILERYTADWGLRPYCVESGEQALAALRRQHEAGEPIGLAILDMRMPGMDGAALAREIVADPALRATHLIHLTAIGCLTGSAGTAIRVSKPVKPQALHEALHRAMQQTSDAPPAAAAAAAAARPGTRRGRILIAEDNPVNQRVASLQVERCGFDADVVANGEEALAALERLDYALVLMDCQMPCMDGYAATRELRSRENGSRRTPVIALTANAFAADREACLQAGMDDHLAKPVSLRNLGELLDRWCPAPD